MAIPSGSGSEVLKRAGGDALDANAGAALLTVPALHIYTVLTIHIIENAGNAEILSLYNTNADDSNANTRLVRKFDLPAWGSYVHNDKFVLHPADTFRLYTESASNLDYWISYIDQDWT